jgi:hypothetical protein
MKQGMEYGHRSRPLTEKELKAQERALERAWYRRLNNLPRGIYPIGKEKH